MDSLNCNIYNIFIVCSKVYYNDQNFISIIININQIISMQLGNVP